MAEIAAFARENRIYVGLENMEKRKKELVLTVEDLNRFACLGADNPYFGVTLDYAHFATNGIFRPDLAAQVLADLTAAGYGSAVVMEIKSVYDWQVFQVSAGCLTRGI